VLLAARGGKERGRRREAKGKKERRSEDGRLLSRWVQREAKGKPGGLDLSKSKRSKIPGPARKAKKDPYCRGA